MSLRAQIEQALTSANVQAFLRVLRWTEGTGQKEDAYRTFFGGGKFDDFSDHPRKVHTFTLGGKPISSSAAGAYQFLARTWDECRAALALPDFGPRSQDMAAVFLVRRRGALQDLLEGRIGDVFVKCRNEWASLPGSPYGQPTKKLDECLRMYQQFGGTIAGAPSAGQSATATLPSPQPAQENPAAGQPGPSLATPAPQLPPKESKMAPLLGVLAGAAIDLFSPIFREKITREMNRHTDRPEVAEQIADKVIHAAKVVTGLDDPVSAVGELRKDPELARRAEALTAESMDAILTLAERMHRMDEASVAAARRFSSGEDWMLSTPWLRLKFIHILSIVFVSFAGWFVIETWESLTPELRGAVITLMVIAGWNGVRDFWMGSSDGSQRKTEELMRRATRGE
jgi:muramidase (phage lysozyme)